MRMDIGGIGHVGIRWARRSIRRHDDLMSDGLLFSCLYSAGFGGLLLAPESGTNGLEKDGDLVVSGYPSELRAKELAIYNLISPWTFGKFNLGSQSGCFLRAEPVREQSTVFRCLDASLRQVGIARLGFILGIL